MNKPYINALGAATYIILVASLMRVITGTLGNKPDTIFAPMLLLSLLVVSVAIMGWLFFYEPVKLLVENRRKEAMSYFGRIIGTFVVFVIVLLIINFLVAQ